MVNKIGNRYAEAIYELSLEENKVTEINSVLQDASMLYQTSEEFKQYLTHPLIERIDKYTIIEKIFGDSSDLEKNVLFYLIDKGRFNEIKSIAEEFKAFYYRDNNIVDVKATFANEINEQQKERLIEKLKNSTGKTVNLEVLLDPALIGGGIIKIGDKIIDGSIKTQLENLGKGNKTTEKQQEV